MAGSHAPEKQDCPGVLMESVETLTLWSWVFRGFTILVGLIVMFMGLTLFRGRKAYEAAGNVTAAYGGGKLSLHGTAGTFFVVVGALIMLAGLLKPMEFEYNRGTGGTAESKGRDSVLQEQLKIRHNTKQEIKRSY
jgi:hypothetical protein